MKNKTKTFLTILLIILASMIIMPNTARAALQSNGGTPATKNVDQWMLQIRQMQSAGGTLGLTDTINATGLTSTNTNLDIHMEKNTEFGAMAILSASSYGKPDKVNSGQTTTGNKTGVVINLNKEWVAAGTISSTTTYRQAVGRYKNAYTTTYAAKAGDAIKETEGWHGSSASTWLSSNNVSGLLRSYSGSFFSYYGYSTTNGTPHTRSSHGPTLYLACLCCRWHWSIVYPNLHIVKGRNKSE